MLLLLIIINIAYCCVTDEDCTPRQFCNASNICECFENYYGTVTTACDLKVDGQEWSCGGCPNVTVPECDLDYATCGFINSTCKCFCIPNYFGVACGGFECYGYFKDHDGVCNGNGQCVDLDTCFCDAGYSGSECEYSCDNVTISLGDFRWMAGSNLIDQLGVYGTKGDYSPINVPGSRGAHTSVLYLGTIIIFGGSGYNYNSSGRLNDVWQFDISTKYFRWIAGTNLTDQFGVYGTKGDYSPTNVPGSRYSHTSISYNNTMIIFGGFGNNYDSSGRLNDMWQIDISTKNFRWIAGTNLTNQLGVYGTKDVYSPTNVPGSRYRHSSILYDGTMIIFGGTGYNYDSIGFLNDVWQFDISTKDFRWIAGTNLTEQLGVYGIKDVYSPTNVPGSRYSHTSILYDDTMIIFGGVGYNYQVSTPANLNDVWQFDISTGNFKWIGGSNLRNQIGVYGLMGVYSPTNVPGSRAALTSILYKDSMIIFGGNGFDIYGDNGYLNDVWKFNILTKQFVWIEGTSFADQLGNYGIKGTYSSTNVPGGRTTQSSILYGDTAIILSGYGYSNSSLGNLKDVWQFDIVPVCFGYTVDFDDVCSGNGGCVAEDVCCCEPGFIGSECDQVDLDFWCPVTCFGIVHDDPRACGEHGDCIAEDECLCDLLPGFRRIDFRYDGDECNVWYCGPAGPYNNTDPRTCSGNGECIDQAECVCDSQYTGDFCDIKIQCFGLDFDDPRVCGTHGNCVSNDTCECDVYVPPPVIPVRRVVIRYEGDECNEWVCGEYNNSDPRACSGNGECNDIQHCECDCGYCGVNCDIPCEVACDPPCANGTCVSGVCECCSGYVGEVCDEPLCANKNNSNPEVCNERGNCIAPNICNCTDTDYGGSLCNQYIYDDPAVFYCEGRSGDRYLFSSRRSCGLWGICVAPDTCVCNCMAHGTRCQYRYYSQERRLLCRNIDRVL